MSTRPIIAVDMDDVLAHHVEAFIGWSNTKYGTTFTLEDYNDHWSQLWSIDHEESEKRAVLFHQERQHRLFQPRKDALEVLHYLKKHYDLVIITARRRETINDSHEWLETHFPDIFKDVRFVPIWEDDRNATKLAICKEIGATYLIDDMVRHINLAAEGGVTALWFGDYKWNQNEKAVSGVVKAKDWQAVRDFFENE